MCTAGIISYPGKVAIDLYEVAYCVLVQFKQNVIIKTCVTK